jgi:hypothetical protein
MNKIGNFTLYTVEMLVYKELTLGQIWGNQMYKYAIAILKFLKLSSLRITFNPYFLTSTFCIVLLTHTRHKKIIPIPFVSSFHKMFTIF